MLELKTLITTNKEAQKCWIWLIPPGALYVTICHQRARGTHYLNGTYGDFSANVSLVSRSHWPAESCRCSYQLEEIKNCQICPNMSPAQISTLPLFLTSLVVTLPCRASLDTHSLACLPSSSSLEVPSEGELKVQCNVTVAEDQVCFWFVFSIDVGTLRQVWN